MTTMSNFSQAAQLPRLVPVLQRFPDEQITDPGAVLRAQLPAFCSAIQPGQSVAILVGDGALCRQLSILQPLLTVLSARGAEPLLVPLTGRPPQRGVPLRGAQTLSAAARPVLMEEAALRADHLIPVAQIRPHAICHGAYEHGLCEALCCGLDWSAFEADPATPAASDALQQMAAAVLQAKSVPFGLAMLENAHGHLHTLQLIAGAQILEQEPLLLRRSRALMPRLYFDHLDILRVGQIGQDISEFGLDPNLTGRTLGLSAPRVKTGTDITRIVAERLSEDSCGNAAGVGNCDFIPLSLYQQIDMEATAASLIANSRPEIARIPVVAKDLEGAVQAAFRTCFVSNPAEVKMVRIADTRHLAQIEVSENLLPYCRAHPDQFVI
ncbi:MAG: hypothetical protein KH420_06440 [Clostridiales bacterium]|nr:hypothetical protein [Clostridiales bacterium]